MKTQRQREMREILDRIARDHEGDGSGNAHIQDLVAWLQTARPEEQEIMRAVLLDDFRTTLPRRLDWIALGALVVEGAPSVASELEAIARSAEGRSRWRDRIIEALACMGHRPAIDLCLEGLRAGSEFQGDDCLLLANFIKLDPEVALDRAIRYFVEELNSSEQRRQCAANSARSFLGIYCDVDPCYVMMLAERTILASPPAGRQLVSAMIEACRLYRAFTPSPDDEVFDKIQKQLESLNQESTS